MKSFFTYCICLFMLMLSTALSAQDKMKIKDANGNVLLETREDGVLIRKMTTAERTAVAGLTTTDNGLMVYDTDTKSLWLWHDTTWLQIDGVDLVDDADHDSTNERNQSLTLDGTTLKLLDSGGMLTADLSSLANTGPWTKSGNKVYNTSDKIGIGTDDPKAGLHVVGDKDSSDHIMLIENLNPHGNGLRIKIDGSHPLFVQEPGVDSFFVTHPFSGLDSIFNPVADSIRSFLTSGGLLNLSSIHLSDIASPGGLFDQLGLVDFVSGGVCKGVETLVDLANTTLLSPIQLPDLPLDGIPADIPDIPTNLPHVALPNLSWNPADPCLSVGPYDFCVPLGPFTVPLASLNDDPPISTFNTTIDGINAEIGTVNTALENGYDKLKSGITAIDNLAINLPDLQMPDHIGPITCPNPNPWDAVTFQFQSLNPDDYNIVDPLSSSNAFITFSDKYDNKLGAITAQSMGEFSKNYFSKEKVLEIGSYVTGMFSADGGVVKNLMKLGKESIAFYKATDDMGVLYSSGHGDYAEWLERANHNENIGYGDIVGIRGGKISLSVENAEQVMVVSKAPIVLGNIPEEGIEKNGNTVAFIGQVPVKVMGPVQTGDFIIANPATPGFGIAVPEKEITPQQFALAIGKSWETNSSPGFKFVNAIVGMHNNSWTVPVMKLQQQLNDQNNAIQSLTARLDKLENEGLVADSKSPKH